MSTTKRKQRGDNKRYGQRRKEIRIVEKKRKKDMKNR